MTTSPTRDFVDGEEALGAVAADERFRRGQIHQRANRPARPLHRARFEHLGEREQKHHRSALGPFSECDRAGDRHHHQHVDVEAAGGISTSRRGAASECRPAPPRQRREAAT